MNNVTTLMRVFWYLTLSVFSAVSVSFFFLLMKLDILKDSTQWVFLSVVVSFSIPLIILYRTAYKELPQAIISYGLPLRIRNYWYCGSWYMYGVNHSWFSIENKTCFDPSKVGLVGEDTSFCINGLIPAHIKSGFVGLYRITNRYVRDIAGDLAPWDDGMHVDLALVSAIPVKHAKNQIVEANRHKLIPVTKELRDKTLHEINKRQALVSFSPVDLEFLYLPGIPDVIVVSSVNSSRVTGEYFLHLTT